MLSVDIHTVKVEDLKFKKSFAIKALRNDYLTALVMYFDVGFTKIHKPLWISTGPRAQYTHWRQTVFYLHKQLTMNKVEYPCHKHLLRPH